MGFIVTRSGKVMDFENPLPSSIDILDIAHGLSRIPRFSGQTVLDWNVAQHCMMAALLAVPEIRLAALMHDAHEAYTGDIPTPLKNMIDPPIRRIQFLIDKAMHDRLQCNPGGHFGRFLTDMDRVKEIDRFLLKFEAHRILSSHGSFHIKRTHGQFDLEFADKCFNELMKLDRNQCAARFLEMYLTLGGRT